MICVGIAKVRLPVVFETETVIVEEASKVILLSWLVAEVEMHRGSMIDSPAANVILF